MVLPLIKKASVPVIIVVTIIIVMVVLSNGCVATEEVEKPCPAAVPPPRVAQCPFGQPTYTQDHRDVGVVVRNQYALAYAYRYRTPVWACETVAPSELTGTAKRKSSFSIDPFLSKYLQGRWQDYTNSGFDRAHIIPAANQLWNQRAMDATFYRTNVAPMTPNFNRGVWRQFEQWVRTWVLQHGDAYVITGTLFVPNPAYDHAFVYLQNDIDSTYVPTHFYKILVSKRGTQSWQAIAFLFDHNEVHTAPYVWREYVVSISLIESMTDLNFMPNLSATNQARMEAKAANFALWEK